MRKNRRMFLVLCTLLLSFAIWGACFAAEDDDPADSTQKLSLGKNTLSYTANEENEYCLEVTAPAAYKMKFGAQKGLCMLCDEYCLYFSDDESYYVFDFPEADTYWFYLYDSETADPPTKSGKTTFLVEPYKRVSGMSVTMDPKFQDGLPNSDDYIDAAYSITISYDDGTSETKTLGDSLNSLYSVYPRFYTGAGTELEDLDELAKYTGSGYIDIIVDYTRIKKRCPVTFIDAKAYEASHPDSEDGSGNDSGDDSGGDSGNGTGDGTGAAKPGGSGASGSGTGNHSSVSGGNSGSSSGTAPGVKPGSAAPKTFRLNADSIPLKRGQSTKKITAASLSTGDWIVSWKSSNPKIVKVTKDGRITAQKKTGKATLTVRTAKGRKATLEVIVQRGAVKTSKIINIPKSLRLKRGKKKTLYPVLSPLTSSQKLTFRSSDKKIAAVNSKGVIQAKKPGKVTITVKSGNRKASCRVTVTK